MPFLTIASITVKVAAENAAELAPFEVGTRDTTFGGKRVNTVRAEKRRFRFSAVDLTEAEYQTLRAAIDNGAQVSVAGDAIGGTLTCEVMRDEAPYARERPPAPHTRRVDLNVFEV